MSQKIIGRVKEKKQLEELYESGRPEFIVVHGRRRVGKTFLIREMFSDRFSFFHTGLSPANLTDDSTFLRQQLEAFYSSLSRYGYNGKMPADWLTAFDALTDLLTEKNDGSRQVVFIDEMPWMDTARSGFVTAFEHFWNGWGAGQQQLMLIVCGSSTSWITDKIINNKGGLFNRITEEIALKPFTLGECEEFYEDRGIVMDHYDQLQSYMIFGGIPYYLGMLRKGMSLAQNIDSLCFAKKAPLRMEFDRLFSSLFVNPEANKSIVRHLYKKKSGMLRKEISEVTNIPTGGGLTTLLKGLEEGDFIVSYNTYKGYKRDVYYKLVDPFCLFYLHFMDKGKTTNEHFWSDNIPSGAINSWRGLAFENVCFLHIPQIKKALGISGVHTESLPWRSKDSEDGAQIDMLIDRSDRIINVCEMKYSVGDYSITKKYDGELRHKLTTFAQETNCRKALHLTIVTTFGLKRNEYSGHVQNVITMDDLFA